LGWPHLGGGLATHIWPDERNQELTGKLSSHSQDDAGQGRIQGKEWGETKAKKKKGGDWN
jgi:hypothetical protein